MPGVFIMSKHSEQLQQSKLLLSPASALCKFYPQLEVSTDNPKINSLQLVNVRIYCTAKEAYHLFLLYMFDILLNWRIIFVHHSMICCRIQHLRFNKKTTHLLHFRFSCITTCLWQSLQHILINLFYTHYIRQVNFLAFRMCHLTRYLDSYP